MPSAKQKEVPDRSRPETTGRELSLDEMRDDVARLRDIALAIRRQTSRLDGLNNTIQREALQTFIEETAYQIEQTAEANVEAIRATIYAVTESKDAKNSKDGYYKGGRKRK